MRNVPLFLRRSSGGGPFLIGKWLSQEKRFLDLRNSS